MRLDKEDAFRKMLRGIGDSKDLSYDSKQSGPIRDNLRGWADEVCESVRIRQ